MNASVFFVSAVVAAITFFADTIEELAPPGNGAAYSFTAQGCPSPMPRPLFDEHGAPLPPADFVVFPNSTLDYNVNGQLDPAITLTRGQSYIFDLTGVGPQHPFLINSNALNTGGAQYVTPTSLTTITFTPDFVMPATIYYRCNVHFGNMVGTITLVSPAVQVAAKVLLEGPYVSGTGLMSDGLRTGGLIPAVEPYTGSGYVHLGGGGGETVSPAVLAVSGSNAIVDWVVVELRDEDDPSVIVSTRSALVQRDGDVVSTNGTSPVSFAVVSGNYHVAVHHRNHLGAMVLAPLALSAVPTSVDLTAAITVCYGTDARKGVGLVQVLWAGDVSADGVVQYTGTGNDRDPILVTIGGTVPTNTATGYLQEDVTMDGVVGYTGGSNDRDPILVTIGGSVPTNFRLAQLP